MENPIGLLFVFGGLFTMAGGIFNWEWYMTSGRARFMVNLIGRSGARIFYGVLGFGLVILGFAFAFNLV